MIRYRAVIKNVYQKSTCLDFIQRKHIQNNREHMAAVKTMREQLMEGKNKNKNH